MPSKSAICEGIVVAAAVAAAIKANRDARKAARLALIAHATMVEERVANEARIDYMCHLLNEHGVPASEFDLIVLNLNQTAE